MFNALNVQYNRARTESTNLYAYQTDVAGEAGIAGVSTDPFSWGIPSLSFTSVSGMRDQTPAIRTDQTLTIGMSQMKPWKRHSFRWGGDFRWMLTDSRTDSNPRGSFVFTGLYTGYYATPGAGTRSTGTGLDFADFLLGMSQQATLNYGPGTIRFRSRAWSLFFQDDWRVNARLTINAGLRYEYLTPYWEANDSLVNLDANPDFTAVAPVIAGQTGPFTGAFPTSAVDPDRNNLAPRTGVAWRMNSKTVLRGGYGISYSSPVYQSMAQRMSAQPPFATTDTRLGELGVPLLLETAFATPTAADGRHEQLRRGPPLRPRLAADVERRSPAGPGAHRQRGRRLRRDARVEPRHPARAEPRRQRGRHRRRPAFHLGGVGGPFHHACPVGAPPEAAVEGHSARASPTRCRSRATTRRRSAAAEERWPRTTRTSRPNGARRASTNGTVSPPASTSSCRSAATGGGCRRASAT